MDMSMKQYTLEVVITEGCDEYWEEITKGGKTGADEVVEAVRSALFEVGFQENCEVTLKSYRHRSQLDPYIQDKG